MPLQDVVLNPGVQTQLTPELNQAGIGVSQLIRFKTGLAQKYGGWSYYYPSPVSSTPIRDVHAFQSLSGYHVIAAASLTNLVVISCGILTTITPQTNLTNPTPSFSTTAGSNIVTVIDPGSSAGPYQAVQIRTPISVGGIVLSSAYYIFSAISANEYQIRADMPATSTVSSGGTLPTFTTTSGQSNVQVIFPSAAYQAILGIYYPFNPVTNVGGLSIQGDLAVTSIIDSTSFLINAGNQSSASAGPVSMNGGHASLLYYNTQGPPALSGPYGGGSYGGGAYGLGTPAGSGLGTPITVTDWLLDNFGEFLTAVPYGGPLYYWSKDTNFSTAQVVPSAPLINAGGFVSQPQQIMMMYGSVQDSGTGMSGAQDPLLMRWSNSADFTNWQVLTTTTAGSFRVPTGSLLMGAVQAPLYVVAFTDIDVWTATWTGQPLIWSWLRMGTGCGIIGPHAADVTQGQVYWCGPRNIYSLGPTGVTVMPCSVWDFIFQQLDQANQTKVRAAANSYFNEVSWFFPMSQTACTNAGIPYTGENNAYVKLHVGEGNEYEWDYGILSRTAWVDVTVVGSPIGADASGNLLQHETSPDAAGSPLVAYLQTGYFMLGDGTDIAIVDWCLPDMRWDTFNAGVTGTVQFTFYTVDYPGDTERTYGPYSVTKGNEYINVRMRGRFCRVQILSQDIGSFWRVGRIKFRWGPAGRR